VELCRAVDVVDPISRLLIVRVDVCKPPDTTASNVFEICAVVVKQLVVFFLTADASDCIRAVGLNTWRCDGRPTILVKVHLLSVTMLDEPVQIRLHEWPGESTSGRKCREERKPVNINVIDRIEDVLSTAAYLITVSELGNSDGDLYACESSSG